MKSNKLTILFILSVFLLLGCKNNNNNTILYQKNAKLKQISLVESIESDKIMYIISEYEYDELGRISKVSSPSYKDGNIQGTLSYDIYIYDNKNLLKKIVKYNANLYAGFLNLETEIYIYDDNGNKLKLAIEYPQINKTDSIFYFYDNNRLVRENKYDGFSKKIIAYTEYEYNNQGELVKEADYSMGENDTPIRITKHSYQNGLNVKTEIFTYSNNEKIREINRFYDNNDNLIYLDSRELSIYSSAMSYVTKYEYY